MTPRSAFGRVPSFHLYAIQHRIERGVEQRLHEAVRRVITAGRLAGVPLGFEPFSETKLAPIVGDARGQFEQAFVDGAELLRLHVAPVDRHSMASSFIHASR